MANRKQSRCKYVILPMVLAVIGFLTFAPGTALANDQIDIAVPRHASDPGVAPSQAVLDAFSATGTASVSQARRRKRKKLFFMPALRAENKALAFSNYVKDTTTTDIFDRTQQPFHWDRAGAQDCKRKTFSRVVCLGWVENDFVYVDENDVVTGEDTYVCTWYFAAWYPFARKAKLNTKYFSVICYDRSEV